MTSPGAARLRFGRVWRRLRGGRQSPARLATAVAAGLFIGSLPLYGLHFLLCLLLCVPLGLDFVVAYLAANISNPFVAPFLITLEVEVGSLLTTGQHAAFTLARAKQTGILGFAWQAGVGSVLVGAGLAALGGSAAYAVARACKGEEPAGDEPFDAAIERTIARYARAPIADRFYVAGKLRSDPLARMLSELPGDFGRVLDAGAGRGQFGLLLLELGRCRQIRGLDADPRKVRVARAAAGDAARFEFGDLLDLPECELDTVLLIDVLHYLPFAEQGELLLRVAGRVQSGRILIRELDGVRGARSFVTRAGEWFAKLTGYNRGRATRAYRPASEIVAELTRLGFSCQVRGASVGTPFGNVLIVATGLRHPKSSELN